MEMRELQYLILRVLAENQPMTTSQLANQLGTNIFRISKNLRQLKEYKLVRKEGRYVELSRNGTTQILARFILDHPLVENVLANKGLEILQLLEEPRSLNELGILTKISSAALYGYLRIFSNRGMITESHKKYSINDRVWPDLRQLVSTTRVQSDLQDPNIPVGAKIYIRTKDRTVLSSPVIVHAPLTAFSVYSKHGIPIMEDEKIYHLSPKTLSMTDILIDSLDCATDVRRKILCALFYLKHKEVMQSIQHPVLNNIKKVLYGEKIRGYPSLEEIKQRAEVYDIQIQ